MKSNQAPLYPQKLLRFTFIAAGVLAAVNSSRLEAANISFDAAGNDGVWSLPVNWNPDGVPQPADLAFVRGGRIARVDSNVGTVTQVILGETDNFGTVSITAGGSLGTSGNFQVMRQGTFSNIVGNLSMSGGNLSVGSTLLVGVGLASTTGTGSSGTASFSGGTFTGNVTVGSDTGGGTSQGFFNVTGSSASISGGNFAVNPLGRLNFSFASAGVTTLNFGTSSFASGSLFSVNGALYAGAGGDFTLVDSTTLNWNVLPANVSITGFNGYTTQLLTANNDVVLRLTAIPEPSAYLLVAALPLAGFRRKRRSFITA